MGFSIGVSSPGIGPRGAIDQFGDGAHSGKVFDKQVISRLLSYLRPYWKRMALALIATVALSGLTLYTPYLLKVAIDQYITQKDIPGLTYISLLTAASFVGLYLTTSAQQYMLSWIGQRVLANLRHDLFSHIQELSMGYHDRHIVGVTVSRVINDVAVINELLSQGVVTLVGDVLVLVGIIIIMLSLSWELALLSFIVLPLMVLATWLFSRQARVAFRRTRSSVAAVVSDLAEEIAGMRVIQAFAQEKTAQKRFNRVNVGYLEAHVDAMTLSFVFIPVIEFLGVLASVIVLWFGGLHANSGGVTLGALVAFLSYVTRFFQPIQELSQLYTTMQSAMAAGEQVIRLLDAPIDVLDRPTAIEMPSIRGKVSLDKVSFRYRPETPEVLHEVTLNITPGQTVALVGPTGAGKTSIANLVARFYDVNDGAVCIDGIDVREVTQRSLRQQIGIVPQDAFLFSDTIAANIRLGNIDAADAEVERAAKLSNAHDFISKLSNGYQTKVLEGGVNLSVGQRQLICIARAILPDPRIIILDEATANVDTMTESLIQDALKQVLVGRTAIIIAHRLSTIRTADVICVVTNGQIVEKGKHEELISLKGIYFELYEKLFMK
jgi:ABC-type multidrug transport system fused ATPase/permease subunit